LSNYQHLVLTNYGVEKGKSIITGEVVESVKGKIMDEVCCG
jgi:hypothetical protein